MSPEAAGRNRRKLTVRSVYQCLYEAKDGCTKAELAERLKSGEVTQEEAIAALTMLGFAAAPSQKAVLAILKKEPDAGVEHVIKLALKML